MKYLNKLSSAFCTAALGLLVLAGCEGGDIYNVNAPGWISDKIDSIANSGASDDGEELVGMQEDVYTIGNTDYSSGWWVSFSKYYVIPENGRWDAVFNLSINPSASNTYKNFALIITNDVDRGGDGYAEYGAIRYDTQPSGNSEWGDYINRDYVLSNLQFSSDTDEGIDKLAGRVTLTVDRSCSDTALYVRMTNGTVTKTYIQPGTLANLNADVTNSNIRCFLVPEGSYINFLQSNVEPIGGYTSADDKQPVSMVLSNVPAKVDAGTPIEEAMAGVTATVTFEQGVTAEVTAADLQFTAIPDMDELGDKTLVAVYNKTYKGENASQTAVAYSTFKVVPAVASIAITAMPTQTSYVVYTSSKTKELGFPLNTAGLQVTATYVNGDQDVLDISELQIGSIKCERGQQEVTITSENGKTATLQVAVTEVKTATDVCPDPKTVGAEDNSSAFWGDLAQDITVPSGKICAWYFTNYSSCVANWNNWVAILRKADLTEYAVVRADNYGWGTGYENNPDLLLSGGQANWDTWRAAMNGAKVAVYVENKGDGKADVTAVMQGTDGTTYGQYYRNIVVDASDLNVSFTVDGSYLVFE